MLRKSLPSISKIVLLPPLYVMRGYPASVRTFTITSIRIVVVPCGTMVYRELVGFFDCIH